MGMTTLTSDVSPLAAALLEITFHLNRAAHSMGSAFSGLRLNTALSGTVPHRDGWEDMKMKAISSALEHHTLLKVLDEHLLHSDWPSDGAAIPFRVPIISSPQSVASVATSAGHRIACTSSSSHYSSRKRCRDPLDDQCLPSSRKKSRSV